MDESSTGLTWVRLVVVGFMGLLSAAAVSALPSVGGILAGVHLGAVVGLPVAGALHNPVRPRLIRFALAVALSLAISVLSFQVLFWLGYAEPVAVVLLATAYGLLLGWLVPKAGVATGWQVGGTS